MRFAALLTAALLAACGQTGALYLPDEDVETPVEIRGPAKPVPASEEEEKDRKPEPPADP